MSLLGLFCNEKLPGTIFMVVQVPANNWILLVVVVGSRISAGFVTLWQLLERPWLVCAHNAMR